MAEPLRPPPGPSRELRSPPQPSSRGELGSGKKNRLVSYSAAWCRRREAPGLHRCAFGPALSLKQSLGDVAGGLCRRAQDQCLGRLRSQGNAKAWTWRQEQAGRREEAGKGFGEGVEGCEHLKTEEQDLGRARNWSPGATRGDWCSGTEEDSRVK